MKTTTFFFKKAALSLLCIFLLSATASAQVPAHGSIKGTGLQLHQDTDPTIIREGVTFDYKVVTIGSKSWAWTNVTGAIIGGAEWASQLRYWGGATFGDKTENNLLLRVTGTQQTYGSTANAIPNPLQLSFFQALDGIGFSETERIAYDVTAKNSPVQDDNEVPTIESVTVVAFEGFTVTLNFTGGADNSGDFFYYIEGNGVQEVSFLPTVTLTNLTPNTVYPFTITTVDFNGNYSESETITIKTMKGRSNVKDSVGLAYNTTIIPASPDGELTTIIQEAGNTITIGGTTKSLLIPEGSRNKIFNNPSIVIDEIFYPLTLDADNTTATITFTGDIGEKTITPGTLLKLRWSVYWGEAGEGGAPAGGLFTTGIFNYFIGDFGQDDVTGPSIPDLTLTRDELTWFPSTDDLSGVKWYEVTEAGQEPVTIFDLGEASFSYTLSNPASLVTVKAVDFVGNSSSASVNHSPTKLDNPAKEAAISVYPNPATDRIYISGEVAKVALYSLQGQLIHTELDTNTINVSNFTKGLYIVRVTDNLGNNKSVKVEIR